MQEHYKKKRKKSNRGSKYINKTLNCELQQCASFFFKVRRAGFSPRLGHPLNSGKSCDPSGSAFSCQKWSVPALYSGYRRTFMWNSRAVKSAWEWTKNVKEKVHSREFDYLLLLINNSNQALMERFLYSCPVWVFCGFHSSIVSLSIVATYNADLNI